MAAGVRRRRVGFAEEGFGQGAPGEGDSDQNSEACDCGHPRQGAPDANQHLKLSDEAAESRQPDRSHGCEGEDHRGEWDRAGEVHGAEFFEIAGVSAVVDHSPDDGEEQPGDHAVGEHLKDCAIEADLIQSHQAEQDESHVADTGIADDELEVSLNERDACAVDDADQGQQGKDIAPRAEAEQMKSPGIEATGKEHHRHAKTAVSAELHDNSGEQHRRAGWGGRVATRRPGVKGPHTGQHGEAYRRPAGRPTSESARETKRAPEAPGSSSGRQPTQAAIMPASTRPLPAKE